MKDRKLTTSLDLGDRSSFYCVLDESGDVILERRVSTTAKALAEVFAEIPRDRIGMEAGLHSPWVSRLLTSYGHEVIVANARNVRLIGESRKKDGRLDARAVARLARIDPQLLSPIQHRSAQADLSLIRARAALVRSRTVLINTARGLAKSNGERLRGRNSETVRPTLGDTLSPQLQAALAPLLSAVETMTPQIHEYDRRIVKLGRNSYPEVASLTQIHGVGPLIALTYILTLEDPHRFAKSRDAGCYVGLQPARRNSGQSQPQLHISKEGDSYLRSLLIEGAHHILGPFGTDSDLRRWGLQLASRGAKLGKKRAIVAVARKLAVLLHRLWVRGEAYEPLHCGQRTMLPAA